MSLFKRGERVVGLSLQDGVRHQYSTGTANRKQAEKIEAKLKEEVNDSGSRSSNPIPHMKFGELAARFIASGSVRPHHLYHLKFLLPFFSEFPVLRSPNRWPKSSGRQRHRSNHAIKDATINRDLSVLRHILYWAVDEQLLAANPLARLKMARERRTRRQILSVAEEALLLGAAKDHLRAMIIDRPRHRHAPRRDHQPAVGRHRFLPARCFRHALENAGRGIARNSAHRTALRASAQSTASPKAS